MKKSILAIALLTPLAVQQCGNGIAAELGYRECDTWDTFCKSPQQIVATKCRLGVPVKHEQCRALGVPMRYMIRGGGSLVDGLPVTTLNANKT